MFGKTSYTATVRSALEQMLSDEEVNATIGAAKFTRKDKRTIGYIYLREGKVYAAAVNTKIPNLITRLIQGGHLTEENVGKITRHFGEGDENDPHLAEFVIDRHMVPEKTMATIQQDFFLETFSEILAWDEVNADWLQNETTDFFKIDRFEVSKVIELVDTRNAFIESVSKDLNVPLPDLDKIVFNKIGDPELDKETSLIFHQLLSVANNEHSIRNAIDNFGLTFFRTVQSIHDLWHENYVQLSYEGTVIPPYNDSDTEDNETEVFEENNEYEENEEEILMTSSVYSSNENVSPFAAVNDDDEIEIDIELEEIVSENTEEPEIVAPTEVMPTEVTHSTTSNLEQLIAQLSHEIESLKVEIQTSRNKLADEEAKQSALTASIAATKNELTVMEEQYNRIVTQLDNMR